MGWWQTEKVKTKKGKEIMLVNGDSPADLMGDCVERISKRYQDEFGRKPYRRELEDVLTFVVLDEYVEDKDTPLEEDNTAPSDNYERDQLIKAGLQVIEMGLNDAKKFI